MWSGREGTDCFVYLAELLELLSQGLVVSVPCEATLQRQLESSKMFATDYYPMKSFDIL